MLSYSDLRLMAQERIDDAKALLAANRFDGAIYVVGYAVEFRLKARIATSVFGRGAFPESVAELGDIKNLQTHKLKDLIRLAGREARVNSAKYKSAWSYVLAHWTPEIRYRKAGSATRQNVQDMIDAVERLLKAL